MPIRVCLVQDESPPNNLKRVLLVQDEHVQDFPIYTWNKVNGPSYRYLEQDGGSPYITPDAAPPYAAATPWVGGPVRKPWVLGLLQQA